MNKHSIKQASLFAVVLVALSATAVYCTFLRQKKPDLQKALEKKDLVPVLIVGSGPAGLSAALYTARAKLPTVILSGDQPGGTLSDVREIENWPGKKKASGQEAVDDLEYQAQHFGTTLLNDVATAVDVRSWPFSVTTREGKTLHAMALILATGRIAKTLDVPGVEEFWGHGVGVCTICEAPFHKGHIVAVVGGGDTAGDRALQLAAFAEKVYMFVRGDELDASGYVQEYLNNNKKIEILYNTELQKIIGKDDSITQAEIFDTETKETKSLPIKGIYFAIGWHPNSDIVKRSLRLKQGSFIWVDGQTQKTSVLGVFAAGDVTDPRYGKAGVAIGSGVKAGMDAIKFLQWIGFNPGMATKHAKKLYKANGDTEQRELAGIENLSQLKALAHQATQPLLLDFYTDYCPTCKVLLRQLTSLAKQYEDKLKVVKVNIDKAHGIAGQFDVTSVPFFVAFKDGKLYRKSKKIRTKDELEKLIQELVE